MNKFVVLILIASTILLGQTPPMAGQTEFSQEKAAAILKTLSVDIGPRPMGSPAEQRALGFAKKKFSEYGCDTTYIMPFDRSSRANTTSGIAVGVRRGATKRTIVIGGHIDSSGPEIPGADDNASGSSVVIELARVLGQRALQSTLVFACFGGEEQGLEGSKYFADHFPAIDSVVLMLNIDMANGLGIIELTGDSHGSSAPPWLVRAAIEEFYSLNYRDLRYPTHAFVLNYAGRAGAGTDHESFLAKGIPAIGFTTDVTNPIHTPQDNFERFDPRGLKRSGDVVLKLVERFDSGVPNRELSKYWLYVIGSTPIIVPYWAIGVFLGLTAACAALAFIAVRRRRIFPVDVRWSGSKMLLFTFITVSLAWVSSDIVGLLKGYRYPWMTDLPLFYLLAFLFALSGFWLSLLLSKKLPLSNCPYIFYKRAAIILTFYTALFAWGSVELAIYPASALFLLSLAVLTRLDTAKFIFSILFPFWMVRLVFNEWDEFFFRAFVTISGPPASGLAYIMTTLFFTLYVYPVALGLAAVYRDAEKLQDIIRQFRSPWGGVTLAALIIAVVMYLYPREVYSDPWYRTVFVEENQEVKDDFNSDSLKHNIRLRSPEYLDGIRVHREEGDTLLTEKTIAARIPVQGDVHDSSLLRIEREERQLTMGDTTDFQVTLTLASLRRPYTVSVTYSSGARELREFTSTKTFSSSGHSKILRWYSFPDSILIVPVRFQTVGDDSVRERIEVVYNTLLHPWRFERENTNFLLRTTVSDSKVYKPTQ